MLRLLASDYDDTFARHGRARRSTVRAIERLRASGRQFVIVTGRQLGHLELVFSAIELCDAVVAENGAVLYLPARGEVRALAPASHGALLQTLVSRGVQPLFAGEVLLATLRHQLPAVRAAIRAARASVQPILNKEALMLLPRGVDKASGLRAALDVLGVRARDAVAVGDAENDVAMVRAAGVGAAVANAVPELRRAARWLAEAEAGAGVEELVSALLAGELDALSSARPPQRKRPAASSTTSGRPARARPSRR